MISTAATATSFFNQPIDEVLAQHIDLIHRFGYGLKSVAEADGSVRYPIDIVYTSIEDAKDDAGRLHDFHA